MPGGGVEPPRPCDRRILSPLRLPVPPSRRISILSALSLVAYSSHPRSRATDSSSRPSRLSQLCHPQPNPSIAPYLAASAGPTRLRTQSHSAPPASGCPPPAIARSGGRFIFRGSGDNPHQNLRLAGRAQVAGRVGLRAHQIHMLARDAPLPSAPIEAIPSNSTNTDATYPWNTGA